MKKITLLMLLAVLVLPMNAKISTTIVKQQPKVANYLATRNGVSPKAVNGKVSTLKAVTPKEDGSMVWDFEDAEAALAPFTAEDKDGDGYNWTYYNNTGLESGRMTAHEGEGLIASASYDNDSHTALTPDNWLISPEVTLGGSLKFWAMGQDAGYCSEVFGVYVTVDGETYTQIGADKTATGEYVEYEFDLSSYAGQTGKFAIVHHNVTDMFFLNIDDITFDPSGEVTPEPIIPTDVAVVPTATTGEVTWVPGENNGSWNLRWRPYVDPFNTNRLWDLPVVDGTTVPQANDFAIYDADGDGYNWGLAATDQEGTDACFYSASWASAALTPDNWLITPEIKLGGTLKFKAWASGYPDVFAVYVCDNPDFESFDEFVAISEDIAETGSSSAKSEYEFDLSEFDGTGYIAIRHYNCTDQLRIYIDDIEVLVPDPQEVPEWTVVENVESPYTIEGLTPETEYEVEVMAINAEGDKSTDWTESLHFTTLAADNLMDEFYVVGDFNEWNQTEDGGRVALVANEDGTEYTGEVTLEAGAQFKVITPNPNPTNEDDQWIWFGGVDENQAGFFLINAGLLGVDIDLIDGSNFMVEEGDTYVVTVKAAAADGTRAIAAPLAMVITKKVPDAIETISTSKVDNNWYNLQGVKFNGMPTVPGIYINNGKKVIIK